jgi:acetylglutamate kinase
MADPALREGFARDVALLRLVGMNPVIVTAAAGESTISCARWASRIARSRAFA